MPITTSAKKALRQSKSRREGNIAKANAYKDAIKKYKKTPSKDLLVLVYKTLDKAAKANVITKNKAARLKSRFSKLVARR